MAGRGKLESDFFGRRRGKRRRGRFEGRCGSGKGMRWGWRMMRRSAPFGRKGGNSIWWHVGWFEAVNRNGVLFGAYLNKEGMRRSAEDLVRAGVGWGKGWFVGWSVNEDIVGGKEGGRNIRRSVGGRRNG
jgi:hypothetical protein